MEIKTANTILYCAKWEDTVRFYRDYLNLAVAFSTDNSFGINDITYYSGSYFNKVT